MFNDLSGKIGKLTIPEGSLIRKLERIKKTSGTRDPRGTAPLFSDVIEQLREQLRKTPEELNKKIEDLVNSKAEQIKANAEAVKGLESQMSKLEQTVSSGKKGTDEVKERLDKIDETVLELLSLYEVVSSTVNPFVSDKENPVAEKINELDKKIEELNLKQPELSSDLAENFDMKFKTLELSLEELKKSVETHATQDDALAEKVKGLVLEQIKPIDGQRPKPVMPSNSPQPQSQNAPQAQTANTQRKEEAPPYEDNAQGVRLPYLDNRPETSIVILNWIEFLMEKVGRNNLVDVLEYYIEIGWISEEVSSKMMSYASGIDYYVERPTWKLLPEDHTKSLLFIEQLRGRKMDKNLISKLERDLDKIIRSSEILVT
ncbi:MAG: hypothetical protein O8C66_13645 [Candidatus Methanoperedens sp.]|nr:hypothetical protein [Candidatus Methanoperedens sp.]MCZ7371542.1 hypothetical protein [Candidatus Methanoperedens sp.]